ncbi:uroporphyrinogen-III synthase [Sulfitobacter aestuariivivens]|uniref:Uroporphyrinogen-III synthase n=1 Tax=Sulfitobacter aestuariivivens TaxID=2766981 RepID=A0A927D579_9RHOB|nr:uroporphyrinogen-III synthase [Sulfitobacter aestuariivivens]MBD3665194.1 uroporphyrinogen-III synthase [Sulfitobacter aestuariivivens]
MARLTLLMTRPRPSADRFVARLHSDVMQGVDVIHAPLIKIVSLGTEAQIQADQGAIFTSSHGVRLGPDGAGRPAFCVGTGTAKRADEKGWDVRLAAQNADGLVDRLSESRPTLSLVHLAGRHRRGDIAERLSAIGTDVDVITLYDQEMLPLSADAVSALKGRSPVIVPLFSPRTAAHFNNQIDSAKAARVLAMSKAIADMLNAATYGTVDIAMAPTADEMVKGVENLVRSIRLP